MTYFNEPLTKEKEIANVAAYEWGFYRIFWQCVCSVTSHLGKDMNSKFKTYNITCEMFCNIMYFESVDILHFTVCTKFERYFSL
jgi:hypothetical protein